MKGKQQAYSEKFRREAVRLTAAGARWHRCSDHAATMNQFGEAPHGGSLPEWFSQRCHLVAPADDRARASLKQL